MGIDLDDDSELPESENRHLKNNNKPKRGQIAFEEEELIVHTPKDSITPKWIIEQAIKAVALITAGSVVILLANNMNINVHITTENPSLGETPTTTLPDQTPTTNMPTPTGTPASTSVNLGELVVPGNDNEGIQFRTPATGKYTFRYLRGAYCVYRIGEAPPNDHTCLPTIVIFRENTPLWEDDDWSVNQWVSGAKRLAVTTGGGIRAAYWDTMQDAENAAQAQSDAVTLTLPQGEILTLLAIDGKPHYEDNPGSVTIEILFEGEN